MKTLRSCCSKAIVKRLGSSSPRVAVHVSDRPGFCFSLPFGNDRKSSNFLPLKLVQNKGICPAHVLPSENQVNLDAVEPQAQQSEQTNESKFVRIAFQLQKICDFGEQFLLVGDDPILGSWEPSDALPMIWSDGHIWTVELDMPAEKSIQFKFILKGKEGDIIWQPGADRIINTWETMNRITVFEDWENAELQKIMEEDQLSPSNDQAQVDSEVSSFTEILDNPQEELESKESEISAIKDTEIHEEEKPLAEPVQQQITGDDSISSSTGNPMAIVAENIGSPEDLLKSTRPKKNKRNVNKQSEEFVEIPKIDDIMHDLEHNGSAAPLKNQERTIVEESLFKFEGGPVLVPGLTPSIVPTDESGPGEVEIEVEERPTMDTSNGASDTQDQNIPELSEEQVSDDGTPQEINATINDGTPQEINATINNEPEQFDNEDEEQSHLILAMEDRSNSVPEYGNASQNDIQWGRETVKKFLTKLGLL